MGKYTVIVATSLALGLFAGHAVYGQEVEPISGSEADFSAADFDGNGAVSWEEFRNRVVAVFGHLDENEDGRIAGDEHPQASKGDESVQPGNVSAESFTAAVAESFKAADQNADGELSATEWSGTKR